MDLSETKNLPKNDYTPAGLDGPSKLLLRAASLIERDGWCQNTLTSPDGRMCLIGAVHYANVGRKIYQDAEDGVVWTDLSTEAITRVDRALKMSAHLWNDDAGRTKEEVVSKLRAVALGVLA